jgi:hypothetical protein
MEKTRKIHALPEFTLLAVIQGLNQKMVSVNIALCAVNAELKKRLDALEKLIDHQYSHSKA